MKCTCETCKHCLAHPDGRLCSEKLIFVEEDDACLDWETDELFNPTKIVAFAIIVVGIIVLLSKFL